MRTEYNRGHLLNPLHTPTVAQTPMNAPLLALPLTSLPSVILSYYPHRLFFLKYAKDGVAIHPRTVIALSMEPHARREQSLLAPL
jgi:hypothetical protein